MFVFTLLYREAKRNTATTRKLSGFKQQVKCLSFYGKAAPSFQATDIGTCSDLSKWS